MQALPFVTDHSGAMHFSRNRHEGAMNWNKPVLAERHCAWQDIVDYIWRFPE